MKYKCRFKTEEEFIKEFGKNWRKFIGWNARGAMDYLLGQLIKTPITINSFKSFLYQGWSISRNMLTENAPNYLPRKKR